MEVSKEEILHIAELANLKLQDEEIPEYLKNLQDILNFANIVNNAKTDGMEITVGSNENYNVFRKDEVIEFEVSGENIQCIHMLPGYTHNIINLSDTQDLVTVMYCNEIFNPNKPDTFFLPV